MKNILVAAADGSEDIELITTVDTLRRAGFNVTVASVTGKTHLVLARGTNITADALLEDLAHEHPHHQPQQHYDAIVLPGGMPGAKHLVDSHKLKELLLSQHAGHRIIAAICASPAVVLAHHGILTEDTPCTVHKSFEDRIPCKDASIVSRRVVKSNHIITSRGPGTTLEFALTIVAALAGIDKASDVAGPMHAHESVMEAVAAAL